MIRAPLVSCLLASAALAQAPPPPEPVELPIRAVTVFSGAAPLPRAAQREQLELAFGVDEALKVKRTTVLEERRDAGLFNSKRRFTYAYRLELASFAPAATAVVLKEHVPVAELDDVEVHVESTTPAFTTNGQDGILAWTVPLAPKGHQVIDLRFAVDIPSKYDSSGL